MLLCVVSYFETAALLFLVWIFSLAYQTRIKHMVTTVQDMHLL